MRRITILVLLLVAAIGLKGNDLDSCFRALAGDPLVRYGNLGICFYDMQADTIVAAWRPYDQRTPASNMKVVTCAAALNLLGNDYTFATDVALVGSQYADGTYIGNILITGGGDPTLGSDHFSGRPDFAGSIVDALHRRGITRLEGTIEYASRYNVVDTYCNDWTADDLAWDWGPECRPFNYSDNCFELTLNVGRRGITIAEMSKKIPNFAIDNRCSLVAKGGGTTPSLFRGIGDHTLQLRGRLNRDLGTVKLGVSMPSPEAYFATVLLDSIRARGIEITNKNARHFLDTVSLMTYRSPALRDIARSALVRSDNMMTEAILRAIAAESAGLWEGTTAADSIAGFYAADNIDMRALSQSDGSGLARRNAVTPLFMCQAIDYALRRDRHFAELMPVMGVNGTLRNMLKGTPYEGKVAAKSGSMSRVLAYSGCYPADAPRFAFSIISNDFRGPLSTMRGKIERVLCDVLPHLDQIMAPNTQKDD